MRLSPWPIAVPQRVRSSGVEIAADHGQLHIVGAVAAVPEIDHEAARVVLRHAGQGLVEAGELLVEVAVELGTGASVRQGIRLGRGSMAGMGAAVTKVAAHGAVAKHIAATAASAAAKPPIMP